MKKSKDFICPDCGRIIGIDQEIENDPILICRYCDESFVLKNEIVVPIDSDYWD